MYLKKYFQKTPEKQRTSSAIAFFSSLDHIREVAPKVSETILKELQDQRSFLKLIASENFSSLAVQLAMGNLLTDKYSEGFPGHRFYAGCENVDAIEALAIEQVKEIFQCDHAYVQPHSGADANLVAYWSVLVQKIQNTEVEKLGKKNLDELTVEEYEQIRRLMNQQKLMGMSLQSGGHLTHGYRQNVSAKMMKAVNYDVDFSTGLIDYKALEKKVKEEKPFILMAGYSAYPRLINFAKMKEIAEGVKAVFIVDMAHFAGLVAGKAMTGEYNPVLYADIVTSTTHKTLRGPRGGLILCKQEFKETIDKGCPLVLGGPLPHVMAAKAVAFIEANTPEFCRYAEQIIKNAKSLAENLMSLGVTLLTGGTDNHLMVLNVQKSFSLTGRQAETALKEAHLTVNRNAIPQDQNGPWYTSGVRIGTPALTTLGMKEEEMKILAKCIYDLLKNTKAKVENGEKSRVKVEIEEKTLERVKKDIFSLLKNFPLYPELVI